MVARIFALATFIFRTRGAMAGGEEDCSASEGAPVQASALLQAASQRGPKTLLVDAQHLEIGLETQKKVDEALWDVFENNKQCGKWSDAQNKYPGTTSPEECQAKAIENGHAFFTYKASSKQCQTSANCDGKRGGNGWKVYSAPPTPAPTPAPEAGGLWDVFENNKQCGKWSDAQNKYPGTTSPEECQAKAIENGHAFFTYKASAKHCQTSANCDGLRGGNGWKVYSAPAPAGGSCVVSSVTVFTGSEPTQISWKIAGQTTGGQIQQCIGEDYTSADEEVNVDCCLSYGTFLLSCKDDSGNGMSGGYVEVGSHRLIDLWSGFRKDAIVTILQPASDAVDGCVVSRLSVNTGANPTQIHWKIVGKSGGDEIETCDSGDYSTENDDLTTECCLSPGAYMLTCTDKSGDGWIGGFIELGGHKFCDSWTGSAEDVFLIA